MTAAVAGSFLDPSSGPYRPFALSIYALGAGTIVLCPDCRECAVLDGIPGGTGERLPGTVSAGRWCEVCEGMPHGEGMIYPGAPCPECAGTHLHLDGCSEVG